MRTLVLFAIYLFAGGAVAQTLTASCKDPSGRALGVLGKFGAGKDLDDTDSMKGGAVTVSWKTGQPKANIVINTGAGGSVSTIEGILAFQTEEQITFFAQLPGAAYMVSLFVIPKRMLISSHQLFLGMDSGSAIAKTFQARCELTIQ